MTPSILALGDGASRETIEAALRCANAWTHIGVRYRLAPRAHAERADLRPAARLLALYPWSARADEENMR